MSWFQRHRAALWPLLGSVLMAVVLTVRQAATGVSASEWVLLAIQVVMIVSVWGAANITGWEKGKTVQAAILAVLALLASLITDGLTTDEVLQLIITGLSALGVAVNPGPVHPVTSLPSGSRLR